MPTKGISTKPRRWILEESTDAQVAGSLEALRRHPRRETELVHAQRGGWHILGYRWLWGEAEGHGRILVTRSFERLARLLAALYEERRLNRGDGAPRKPAGVEGNGSAAGTRRTDRERVG